MMNARNLITGALLLAGLGATVSEAQAGWGVGVSFGGCHHGCWHGCGFPIYTSFGFYAPPPVYYYPAPVVVQPVAVPVTVQAPPPAPALEPVPAPAPSDTIPAPRKLPSQPMAVQTASRRMDRHGEVDHYLALLTSNNENVRRDSVMQLGRLKATNAVDSLAATLAGDKSAVVREAAARALGLVGSPKAMPALNRAANFDSSNDVRHSAEFAIEVIRVGQDQ